MKTTDAGRLTTIAYPDYAVYSASIIAIEGGNEDNRGCEIMCAVNDTGRIIIYMATNGDPQALCEDDEERYISWCYDIGDYGTGEDGTEGYRDNTPRIINGARRLKTAVKKIRTIYTSDQAAEDMDWYDDIADAVIAAVN